MCDSPRPPSREGPGGDKPLGQEAPNELLLYCMDNRERLTNMARHVLERLRQGFGCDADDVFQDLCLDFQQRQRAAAVQDARAYVARAVVNKCQQRVRLGRRFRAGGDMRAYEALEEQPDHRAIDEELEAELRKAIESLSPSQRKVVVLVYFWGFSQEEVARLMGVSAGRVAQIKQQALANLRGRLEPVLRPATSPEHVGRVVAARHPSGSPDPVR